MIRGLRPVSKVRAVRGTAIPINTHTRRNAQAGASWRPRPRWLRRLWPSDLQDGSEGGGTRSAQDLIFMTARAGQRGNVRDAPSTRRRLHPRGTSVLDNDTDTEKTADRGLVGDVRAAI